MTDDKPLPIGEVPAVPLSGTTIIGEVPGEVVGMIEFNGTLFVATTEGVWSLQDGALVPVEFKGA